MPSTRAAARPSGLGCANNRGPAPDTYNLGASTSSTFATTTLPTGWTVTFKADGGAGNCSSTGATITATGTVAAGSNAVVCVVVSVPAGFAAGTSDLYFAGAVLDLGGR